MAAEALKELDEKYERETADKLSKLAITGTKSQVAQGVLALTVAPIGEQGKNSDAYQMLTRICALAGVELGTINQYREVVAALGIKSDHTAVRCYSWTALRAVAKAPLATVGTKAKGEQSQDVRERFLSALVKSDPDTRWTAPMVEAKFTTVKAKATEKDTTVTKVADAADDATQAEKNEALADALAATFLDDKPVDVNAIVQSIADYSEALRPQLEKLAKGNVHDSRLGVAADILHNLADEVARFDAVAEAA